MATPLGLRLKKARALAGISAKELDRVAGITPGHTSLLESVVGKATVPTVEKLASALGVSLDWLIRGVGDQPTRDTILAALQARRVPIPAESGPLPIDPDAGHTGTDD